MPFKLFMYHIVFVLYFFLVLTCSLPLVFFCVFVPLLCVLVLILAPCLGKLEPIGPLPHPLSLPLGVRCLGMIEAERPLRL